jgi:drug/metabolite transporter (DMT)-like permease
LIASSITYFIPIVAVMWGIYEGEVFLIWHFLGMALIIGGVLILNRFR